MNWLTYPAWATSHILIIASCPGIGIPFAASSPVSVIELFDGEKLLCKLRVSVKERIANPLLLALREPPGSLILQPLPWQTPERSWLFGRGQARPGLSGHVASVFACWTSEDTILVWNKETIKTVGGKREPARGREPWMMHDRKKHAK